MSLLRRYLSDTATLLLALVGAIIIWAVAVRQADPINTQLWQVPVQIIGQPADARLINQGSPSVQVFVQGPNSALAELSAEDFLAYIDLSQAGYGRVQVPIEVELERERLDVTNWSPETAQIELEQIVSRDVPVNVDIRGSVASGHRYDQPVVEPDIITVTGPASRIGNLNEARVTVFLDNARQTLVVAPRPFFYDAQGGVVGNTGLTLSADVVQVTVPVEELEGFAQKPITVQWTGTPAPGYRLLNVSVEPDSILVAGRPTELNLLSRLQTDTIDISGLKESFTQQVALALPAGIVLDQPQAIFVTVEIEPILTSDVVAATPELRALGEGLTATLDVEQVRVFLFGPLEAVDSLEDSDVRVTLDLLGLDVGTHPVEPIVTVSVSDLEVRSIQPEVVTVFITRVLTLTNGLTNTLAPTGTSVLPAPSTTTVAGGAGSTGGPSAAAPLPGALGPSPIAWAPANGLRGAPARRAWLPAVAPRPVPSGRRPPGV